MPGGLLNIVAYGNQNVILNGNPSKTFFKAVYAKYTNFGMQKFRIDFNGQRNLRLNEESKFTFRMPRYAELLLDSYLVNLRLRFIGDTLNDKIKVFSDLAYSDGNALKWKDIRVSWLEVGIFSRINYTTKIFMGYKKTLNQLKSWKLNFDKLIFGKPSYDLFVDDKSIFFNKNWHLKIDKILKNK